MLFSLSIGKPTDKTSIMNKKFLLVPAGFLAILFVSLGLWLGLRPTTPATSTTTSGKGSL